MEKSLKVYTSLDQIVGIVDTMAEVVANTPDPEPILGLLNGFEAIEEAICNIFELQGIDPWMREAKTSSAIVCLPKDVQEVILPNWDVSFLRFQTITALSAVSSTQKNEKRIQLQMALLAFQSACTAMEHTDSDQVTVDLRDITPQGKTKNLRGYRILLD